MIKLKRKKKRKKQAKTKTNILSLYKYHSTYEAPGYHIDDIVTHSGPNNGSWSETLNDLVGFLKNSEKITYLSLGNLLFECLVIEDDD